MLPSPEDILRRLRAMQRLIRDAVIANRGRADLHAVHHTGEDDTIYRLDVVTESIIDEFCRDWARSLPMVVICEGLSPSGGKVYPEGTNATDAAVRIILDPVDGTRGLMYDKRAAWSLAGVAPNKGPGSRLSDIELAVMTELPTSKMGLADVAWAASGQGARAVRQNLTELTETELPLRPSSATTIDHGFATIADFFPGTKVLAGEVMEELARELIGPADVTRATVFEDQYISTGGQLFELARGHDRFIADLRPIFYRIQGQPEGLCAHPYDLATWLVAKEAGVVLSDGLGGPLDGPLDTTTGLAWAGFANPMLAARIGPALTRALRPSSSRLPIPPIPS